MPSIDGIVVFLAIVLIVSIVAGSLLMIAVSVLLLAAIGALVYRARSIERKLQREDSDGQK